MGAPSSHIPPRNDAAYRLFAAKVFPFVLKWMLGELAYRRVPEGEREELAQEIIFAAWRAWPTYDPELASPRAWLRGIVARKLMERARRQRKARLALAGSEAAGAIETLAEIRTWDETMNLADRADTLLAQLPPVQRRVVWLHETVGCTFEEIAIAEHSFAERGEPAATSSSEADRLHKVGMARLRALLAADKRKGRAAVLPISVESLLAPEDLPEPSPEMVDRVLRNVCAQLGFDPPESNPPPSGVRSAEPSAPQDARSWDDAPPSLPAEPRARSWLASALGPFAGILIGVGLTTAFNRCDTGGHRPRADPEQAPVTVAVAQRIGWVAPAPEPTSSSPAGPAANEAPELAPVGEARLGARSPSTAANAKSGEDRLILQARACIATLDPDGALAALSEHARRYRAGLHASARERLFGQVCAALGRTPRDARCSGRP